MFFGMFGAIFLLAQFLQVAHHYSPLSAGVRTLPWTAMPIFVAPVAGLLSDRIGGRRIVATGLFLQAIGLCWLASPRRRRCRTCTSFPVWRSAGSAWRCSSRRSPTWCSRRSGMRSRASPPVRTTRSASSAACSVSPILASVFAHYGGYQQRASFHGRRGAGGQVGCADRRVRWGRRVAHPAQARLDPEPESIASATWSRPRRKREGAGGRP